MGAFVWCNYNTSGAIGAIGGLGESKMSVVYADRESRILEFKPIVPDFRNLIKTCIAFANGRGGRIIIGVENETRLVNGITDKDRDRIYDDFPNSLYDAVSPSLIANVYQTAAQCSSYSVYELSWW